MQVFRPHDGSPAMVGVVGPLQRWIAADASKNADPKVFETFVKNSGVADDLDGDPVFLARNQFNLDYTRERAPGIVFTDIKDVKKVAAA